MLPFVQKLTGNRRLSKAFLTNDFSTINKIIENKEFVNSPLNYALSKRQYDLYRYLLDTHSYHLQLNINSSFILNIPDYETIRITQKTYGKTFNENLVLYKLQNMARINESNSFVMVFTIVILFISGMFFYLFQR